MDAARYEELEAMRKQHVYYEGSINVTTGKGQASEVVRIRRTINDNGVLSNFLYFQIGSDKGFVFEKGFITRTLFDISKMFGSKVVHLTDGSHVLGKDMEYHVNEGLKAIAARNLMYLCQFDEDEDDEDEDDGLSETYIVK